MIAAGGDATSAGVPHDATTVKTRVKLLPDPSLFYPESDTQGSSGNEDEIRATCLSPGGAIPKTGVRRKQPRVTFADPEADTPLSFPRLPPFSTPLPPPPSYAQIPMDIHPSRPFISTSVPPPSLPSSSSAFSHSPAFVAQAASFQAQAYSHPSSFPNAQMPPSSNASSRRHPFPVPAPQSTSGPGHGFVRQSIPSTTTADTDFNRNLLLPPAIPAPPIVPHNLDLNAPNQRDLFNNLLRNLTRPPPVQAPNDPPQRPHRARQSFNIPWPRFDKEKHSFREFLERLNDLFPHSNYSEPEMILQIRSLLPDDVESFVHTSSRLDNRLKYEYNHFCTYFISKIDGLNPRRHAEIYASIKQGSAEDVLKYGVRLKSAFLLAHPGFPPTMMDYTLSQKLIETLRVQQVKDKLMDHNVHQYNDFEALVYSAHTYETNHLRSQGTQPSLFASLDPPVPTSIPQSPAYPFSAPAYSYENREKFTKDVPNRGIDLDEALNEIVHTLNRTRIDPRLFPRGNSVPPRRSVPPQPARAASAPPNLRPATPVIYPAPQRPPITPRDQFRGRGRGVGPWRGNTAPRGAAYGPPRTARSVTFNQLPRGPLVASCAEIEPFRAGVRPEAPFPSRDRPSVATSPLGAPLREGPLVATSLDEMSHLGRPPGLTPILPAPFLSTRRRLYPKLPPQNPKPLRGATI